MVDVNKPVTNPELVKAMGFMKESNSRENQDRVINEVLKAHFITPVKISPDPPSTNNSNEVLIKEKTTISFDMIESASNQKFFLAFTDWDELGKWRKSENQQTIIISFDDFAAMVLDASGKADGFVINPYGHNVTFSKLMINAIKNERERRKNGGVVEQVVQKDTKVQLGPPRVYPKEMVDAISEYLKKQKSVQAAYLQLMLKEGEQSYLVIVDFKGNKRELFDGIGAAAMKHFNGIPLDLIPYDSDFGRKACQNIQPFYVKKKFGFF